MAMKPSDPLITTAPRGTLADAQAWLAQTHGVLNPIDANVVAATLFADAPKAGLDPAMLFALCCDETGDFREPTWWGVHRNCCGLGIEGQASDAGTPTFKDGVDSARALIVDIAQRAYDGQLPPAVQGWASLDFHLPELAAAIGPGKTYPPGTFRTLDDLSNRRAANPSYGADIATLANIIFRNLPDAGASKGVPVSVPTQPKGHVPKPPVRVWWTGGVYGVNREPDQQRQGRIVGTCLHTEQGSYTGTDESFHDPTFGGLTDYQIGGAWDGVNDGVIEEFIDPSAPVVPYANGTYNAARVFGDGVRFVNTFGVEEINVRLRSIEHSDGGVPDRMDRTLTGRQMESSALLCAYIHAEEAGQTSATFDWQLEHRETGTDHIFCPGAFIIQNITPFQQRIWEIMDFFQFGKPLSRPLLVTYPPNWKGPAYPSAGILPNPPKPAPAYAPARPPAFLTAANFGSGTDVAGAKGVFYCYRVWTVKNVTRRRQVADLKAPSIDKDLQPGETFAAHYVIHSGDGRWYVLTDHGTRVLMDDLHEHVTFNEN